MRRVSRDAKAHVRNCDWQQCTCSICCCLTTISPGALAMGWLLTLSNNMPSHEAAQVQTPLHTNCSSAHTHCKPHRCYTFRMQTSATCTMSHTWPWLTPKASSQAPNALLLIDATYLQQWLGIGHPLKRHPFSGLVHSAGELLHTP